MGRGAAPWLAWVCVMGCSTTVVGTTAPTDAGAGDARDAATVDVPMEDRVDGGCECPGRCEAGRCVRAVEVVGGISHTCVRFEEGSVRCRGDNTAYGQLGVGHENVVLDSVEPVGVREVASLAAGDYSVCVVRRDGAVLRWGSAAGRGSSIPAAVRAVPASVEVTAGAFHQCARGADGEVWCWGFNNAGELGDDSYFSSAPRASSGLRGAVEVRAFTTATCARWADDTVRCMGRNEHGQRGDTSAEWRGLGVPFSLPGVTQLSAKVSHVCALRDDGTVWCWGWNNEGQLGDGTTTDRDAPVQAMGVRDAIAVAAGRYHTCALQRGGTVLCWGSNAQSQRGAGEAAVSATPNVVVGLRDAVAIGAGWDHTCAIVADGSVWCWGEPGRTSSVPFARAPVRVRW